MKCTICKDKFTPFAVPKGPKGVGKTRGGRRNNHIHCAECWTWVCMSNNPSLFNVAKNRPWSAIELLCQKLQQSANSEPPKPLVGLDEFEGDELTIAQIDQIAQATGATPVSIFQRVHSANERVRSWQVWNDRINKGEQT